MRLLGTRSVAPKIFVCCLSFLWLTSASETASVVPTWDVKHELACPAPSGPLEDARCDVEAVESANNKQLFNIVEELVNTTYFRLFQINLDKKCKFWSKAVAEKKCESSKEEEYFAALKATKPEKSQCALDLSDSPTVGGKKKAGFSSPPPGLFGGFPVPPAPTTNQVDRTISVKEQESLLKKDVSCNDTTLPEFWMDMCRNIDTDVTGYVNLQLNPERWTGYNGTHVWNAIYYENCFDKLGKLDDMCYEERVLYRLLSGMHASVNIHISLNYYPPSKGKRETWEPNPERFMQHFASFPERLKNLHFSFVVLLRALRKASPYLYNFPFNVGDEWEDSRTKKLVQRLLDSHIMTSCARVFEAFDETLMFRQGDEPSVQSTLKSQFKGVFQNISEVMDCISCQKCKLHGKLELLGIGTALKILLLPEQLISSSLTRNDLVALFNTIAKFSHAIKVVPDLSAMYYQKQASYKASAILAESAGALAPFNNSVSENETAFNVSYSGPVYDLQSHPGSSHVDGEVGLIDIAFGTVASQAARGALGEADENRIIDSILARDPAVLLLAKHYAASNPARFIQHAVRGLQAAVKAPSSEQAPDAIIVGGGLAGLSAALTLLDRGGRVIILEKNGHLGGNSAWASSGVNAVDENNTSNGDSVDAYTQDTLKAAGRGANPLVSVLTGGSVPSLGWLRGRLQEHLKLDLVGQLGGHSFPRTHRPSTGLAGSSIVFAIQKQLEKYAAETNPRLRILKWSRATKLIKDESTGAVVGVEYVDVNPRTAGTSGATVLRAHNVILTTGGYASDYTETSLIKAHRPDLLKYATTNGKQTTGDGHKLALAVGAAAVDLDDIQVHPTGFVNPEDPDNKVKTLCAEILRGEGGILLTRDGLRFANELGTRDYVTGRMLETDSDLQFAIVLNQAAAAKTEIHIPLYVQKGLIRKFETVEELARWTFWNPHMTAGSLRDSFAAYDEAARTGNDPFGKKYFHNVPFDGSGPYYAGIVTPVIHYCMGGLRIDAEGAVLTPDGSPIPGLHAAGEVIGGLHGKNRLGGNALTECVVFGRVVGNKLRLATADGPAASALPPAPAAAAAPPAPVKLVGGLREIAAGELRKHTTRESCWVLLHWKVYDFTHFLDEHPAGAEAILRQAGGDASEIFDAIHSQTMLDDFKPIGVLAASA